MLYKVTGADHSVCVCVCVCVCGTTDFTWTVLTMSLLPFWGLNVVVPLLSMQGQKVLRFHQKYLNLCYKDKKRCYRFGTT